MLARIALCAASLLLVAAGPGNYSLIGVGTNSCGKWLADRSGHNAYAGMSEEQWVVGFLSGIGYDAAGTADPLNGTDADGVWAWIDNYCRANPLDKIAKAAAAFASFHPR